jgi:hypothetical protein
MIIFGRGWSYGPDPEPGTEASKEATRNRKTDGSLGLVGKWMKMAGKKKMTALKAIVAQKGTGAASSRAASAPP